MNVSPESKQVIGFEHGGFKNHKLALQKCEEKESNLVDKLTARVTSSAREARK